MNTETKESVLNLVLAPFFVVLLVCMFLQYANWIFVIIVGALVARSSLIKKRPLMFDVLWFGTLFLVIVDTALAIRVAVEKLYFTHSISKAMLAISSSLHVHVVPFGRLPKVLAYLFITVIGVVAIYNKYFPLKESNNPGTLSEWYRNYLMISFIVIAAIIAILVPTYYP